MSLKPEKMIFRDYRPEDFEKLSALWVDLGMGHPSRGDTPEIIKQTIQLGGKLILLENSETNEILGSSWMTFDGRRVFLHHFGIAKELQGQGWGKKLAAESLAFIKKQGYQVKLEVHKENKAAKALYEKLGFFAFTDYDIYMIRDAKAIPYVFKTEE